MLRTTTRPFILPYEPDYTAHRTSKRRLRNARMLARQHVNVLGKSPSIAPELPAEAGMPAPRRRRSKQPA